MAVSIQETVFNYVANGVTVDFAYGCQILAASDLIVFVDDVQVTTGFTVNGVGVAAGGSITFAVAPTNAKKVRLERIIKLERTTAYQQSGDFLSRIVNPDFDRLWMALQRINYFLGAAVGSVARVLKLGDADTNGTGAYRAQQNRIQDLADAVGEQDAMNKRTTRSLIETLIAGIAGGVGAFLQAGIGAVVRTFQDKLRETVSVFDFMTEAQIADVQSGAPVMDHSAAIQAALSASGNVVFPDGTYFMLSGVTKTANNVTVNFGNAKFINGGAAFLFNFGSTSNTPLYTGLRVWGGIFEQLDPATPNNLNYIRIAGTKDFAVMGSRMKNVSNGGVYVEAGCERGYIKQIVIDGKSEHPTCRGIWLNGATATDYAAQLIDESSITRNATPVPAYAVKSVKITECDISLPAYGVYLINTRDCEITDNRIDITGSNLRCIALNNYSPRAKVKGNTFIGDRASTGILVTQFSHDVKIEDNEFQGTFGSGRDIYVAYLADAEIANNRFLTDSTQQVQINMGGSAIIHKANYFTRSDYAVNTRAVYMTNIDPAVAGIGTYGNTATVLPGLVFKDNIVKKRVSPVMVNTLAAQNGNVPGFDVIVNRDNTFYDFNTAAGGDEHGMRIYANGTVYPVKYAYFGNTVFPEASALRNGTSINGSGLATAVRTDVQLVTFRIVNPAAGGAVTVSKLWGGNFSCPSSRSGIYDMLISPRTIAGSAGSSIAIPISVVDANGVAYKYDIRASGSNYLIRVFDSAGAQITLTTTAVTFDVTLAHSIC